MSRAIRTAPLLVRHALADIGASVVVAILVLAVAFTVAAAPRALALSSTAELRGDVHQVAAPLRDISSVGPVQYASGAGKSNLPPGLSGTFGRLDQALHEVPASLPHPLSNVLGQAEYFGRVRTSTPAPSADQAKNSVDTSVRLAVDPRIESRITMVTGTFPATDAADSPIVDVTMSVASATRAHWDVGEVRRLDSHDELRLSGTFRATEPGADYWAHALSVLRPETHENPTAKPYLVATVYVAPGTAASTRVPLASMVVTAWYPIDTDGIESGNVSMILPQLRKFLGAFHSIPGTASDQPLTLSSSTLDALETSVDRSSLTDTVVSMAASGPLGVALAVLALGALSLVERRRAALSLAWARGGSGWQVRGAMALEGALVGVVPAFLACALAVAVVPGSTAPVALVPAIFVGLAPAVFSAVAASPRGFRTARADLDTRSGARARIVVESIALLLAVVALTLLLRRGIANNGVFDPLLAATPLLLSLAVTVVVLRLYPLPLYALLRTLARGRGIVGFLGAARGVRDPATGATAVFAVVVAVAVSVFSVTLLSTLDSGQRTSARAAVGGGDISVSTPLYFSARQLESIAAVPGVRAVASVQKVPQIVVDTRAVSGGSADLLEVDTSALSRIRTDLPARLDARVARAVPVLVSDDLDPSLRVGSALTVGGIRSVVAAVLPADSGLGSDSQWVLMDRGFAHGLAAGPFAPQLAILSAPGGSRAVTDAVASVDDLTAFTTYDDALAQTRGSPASVGLSVALGAGVLVGALLAAIALVLSSVIAGRSRDRTIGALRTMGLTRAQSAQLVLWELAPVVITALLAGTALGLLLPLTVLATVDLTAFTGGAAVTAPAYPLVPIIGVISAVLVASALASLVAVLIAVRRTPATTVTIGAD